MHAQTLARTLSLAALCATVLSTAVLAQNRTTASTPEPAVGEQSFFASAYLGNLVDTFAPDSIGDYQNPEAGGQKTRHTFGISFDARLAGSDDDQVQFWVFAETLHGVRSADLNCDVPDDAKPALCKKDGPRADKAKYILEHATSLEAYISPRLEFLTLQTQSNSPIRVYVTGRLGFIALSGSETVYKNLELGGGFLLDGQGPFAGSYLDLGWGRNELFQQAGWKRFKVDGTLVFSLEKIPTQEATSFFIRMRLDNDVRGNAADAIQTMYGLSWDIGSIFGS